LIVSGQVGMGPAGHLVSGGTSGELRQAIANLEAQLATQGAKLDQVVKTTVFLRHMGDYTPMNEVYIECFGDHRPARSAVGVAELPLGALVEVEAWAWVGE
jgi:2-iminobutanoate/2-iminopropanoate deaminase